MSSLASGKTVEDGRRLFALIAQGTCDDLRDTIIFRDEMLVFDRELEWRI